MNLSIRWKVALGTLLALTLGLAVAGFLAFRSIEHLELLRAEEALSARTGLIAFTLEPLLTRATDRPRLRTMARELGRHANARVTVIDHAGTVLADSDLEDDAVAQVDNHGTRPEVQQAFASGRGTHARRSDTTGRRTVYLALRVTPPGSAHPSIVRLGLPLTLLEQRVRDLQRTLAIAFGVAFIVSVTVSFLIARGLTRPLQDMAAVARQLAGGALGQRVQIRSNDEVGVLAATLNQMADQMDRDITALRRLEQVRKDFVANVSHELRTPLTSIKGYVEALLDGAKDNPDEAVRFLQIILRQSDRLNLILEDLLQLSQIESGLVRFKREPVHLGSLIERTLPLIKPLADKKRQSLTVAVPPDLPPVSGDEDRLVQVLTNLLDNAIKYTPEGGAISITGVVAAQPSDSPAQVELSIADTGIGIPEADRPRVFERFYRVDKARSREMGGTGLGLSIVKHIVEGHAGRIWVEGMQPTGSRFVLRLPITSGSPGPTQTNLEITA
jgi:signal transduction histidine kinase